VTDVTGLRSNADADGWLGLQRAIERRPCARAELITSSRPSEYRRNLQVAVDHHTDLVIAGSFLLSDAVVDAAHANPATRFVLVDPILVPARQPNLGVLVFRDGEAVYLAGALAAMVSRTGTIAGVYGPGGLIDRQNRIAFEAGAHEVRDLTPVLGAYQPPSEGEPYENPAWGARQARLFLQDGADVILGVGGGTGRGAIQAADEAGRFCIAVDLEAPSYPASAPCLLASTHKFIDHEVEQEVLVSIDGQWSAGDKQLGIAQGAVALNLSSSPVITPDIRARLARLSSQIGQAR
jgi:basic membrane protein A